MVNWIPLFKGFSTARRLFCPFTNHLVITGESPLLHSIHASAFIQSREQWPLRAILSWKPFWPQWPQDGLGTAPVYNLTQGSCEERQSLGPRCCQSGCVMLVNLDAYRHPAFLGENWAPKKKENNYPPPSPRRRPPGAFTPTMPPHRRRPLPLSIFQSEPTTPPPPARTLPPLPLPRTERIENIRTSSKHLNA